MLFARSISFVWFNSQLRVSYCDKECFFFLRMNIFFILDMRIKIIRKY
jgi:hypothetical protein